MKKVEFKIHYSKKAIVFLLLGILLSLPLYKYNTGLGQDDCAVFLAALRLPEYSFLSLNPGNSFFLRLFDYSHGGFNLLWLGAFYALFSFFHIPLYTWVFTLPATVGAWLTAMVIYLWVNKITQSRRTALGAFALFLVTPIMVGMGRQYCLPLNFLRIFFLFAVSQSLSQNKKIWKWVVFLTLGLMIFSDNGFPAFIFLAVGMIFLHYLLKSGNFFSAMKDSLCYWFHGAIVFPVFVLAIYVLLYKKPVHAGYGFIAYSLCRKMEYAITLPKDFFKVLIDNFGFGLGAIYPVIMLLSAWLLVKKSGRSLFSDVLILFLWAFIWLVLGLIVQPWELGQLYLFEFTAIPVAMLTAIFFRHLFSKSKNLIVSIFVIILLGNAAASALMIFHPESYSQRVYGAPRPWEGTRIFKAIGTIFRNEGFDPLVQRNVPYMHFPVVIAGKDPGLTAYPAIFYWGTDIAPFPSKWTQVIVVLENYSEMDIKHKNEILLFAAKNNFFLKKKVVHKGETVAWLYYKDIGNQGGVEVYDQNVLMREWDKKYATVDFIRTTGAHAL